MSSDFITTSFIESTTDKEYFKDWPGRTPIALIDVLIVVFLQMKLLAQNLRSFCSQKHC
jgi:hypothetical protein